MFMRNPIFDLIVGNVEGAKLPRELEKWKGVVQVVQTRAYNNGKGDLMVLCKCQKQ